MRSRVLHAGTVAALAFVLAAALLAAPVAGDKPSNTAHAADLSLFDPGNIISDAVFWDATSMDAATVQSFLNAKGSSCRPASDGTQCLKDYRVNTTDRSGDSLCAGYQGAAQESAAVIITKVAQSCRTNPRVLLVLLQKEQTLVTGAPTAKKYERAAGYACPDNGTGACDPTYAGLENQLYRAAWQYRKYAATPNSYGYRAGIYNQIAWSPNSACGKSSVFIVNQATAGLYNYTPYRPNQAALDAGYGYSSDTCASYGNRNFYNFFTDWFGSTGFRTTGAIGAYYISQGGGTGWLGGPLDEMYCGLRDGGCGQDFEGGAVYWSAASGTFAVSGAIRTAWVAQGAETGAMAYPNAAMFCGLRDGGCAQWFQGGAIYWSPASGAHPISGNINTLWAGQGFETGFLGYPTADMKCGPSGGCSQSFQGGSVHWSPPTGTHATSGAINAEFSNQGSAAGALGYPTSDMKCGLAAGGCGQDFSNGAIYWTATTAAQTVPGVMTPPWNRQGRESGPLGYPTAKAECGLASGGCAQNFQGGSVYWSSSSGAYALTGTIGTTWVSAGADTGPLGYPVADQRCTSADACSQQFQRGLLATSSAGGVRTVSGGIGSVWASQGSGNGPLGYPVADMNCALTDGGCGQQFQNGSIYWSSGGGAHAVTGTIGTSWVSAGADTGPLGYPVADQRCTSADACSQQFQRGLLATSSAGGVRTVSGGIGSVWVSQGAGDGPLGYPVADMDCTLAGGGCQQGFQSGTIVWSPATGAFSLSGAIKTLWTADGGPTGFLGYPAGSMTCGLLDGGCKQPFQGGWIYWSGASGTHAISGGINIVWQAQGAEKGSLGYPSGDLLCVNGGCYQQFQRGLLTWTAKRGVLGVSGAIAASWGAQGAGSGSLGYPTGPINCALINSGCKQGFDHGTVYWSPATGAHPVSGPIAATWNAQQAERGSLGYPTSDPYPVSGGQRQDFQHGSLTLDSGTGSVTRS